MPDHLHFLSMGLSQKSDQLKAIAFLWRHLTLKLPKRPVWQRQAHDHVLRPEERERNAFLKSCEYIRLNPVRAGLVESTSAWQFCSCIVPGFPDLDIDDQEYWEKFWKIHSTIFD